MGVKGLQYYTENFCPPACQHVSIIELANRCREVQNRNPVLVVDGMSVLHRLYKMDNLEWLYGGQWRKYIQNFQTFVQRFKDENIELVFYFDGTPEAIKTNEWIHRRIEKLKDVQKIFDHIENFHTPPDERFSQLPAGMGTLIRFALKNICRCVVVNSVMDADKEIAKFAFSTPHCFAILSQDTDYIIFNTKPYLSVSHLRLASLETIMYDRDALASSLGLTVPQLPMFSCLVGNDFISVDSVRPLHRYLTAARGRTDTAVVIPKVAEYVQSLGWHGGNFASKKIIEEIARYIGVEPSVMHDSLNYYCLFSQVQEECPSNSDIIRRQNVVEFARMKHRCCQWNPHIYTLITQKAFKSSECLEDQQSTGLMPSSLIFRCMRQRWYAILFDDMDIEVEELSAIQGVPILLEKVKPEPFLVFGDNQPNVRLLWDQQILPTIRWRTFLAGLDLTISQIQLNDINPNHMGLACLINFLLLHPVGDPRLAAWEVDALVAQAVSPLANQLDAITDLQIDYVDGRAIHLATIVLRGLTGILGFLQVCNNPFPTGFTMPWNCFDGKLFHYLYGMAKQGASLQDLVQHDPPSLRAFFQLRSVAVSGTYIVRERYE